MTAAEPPVPSRACSEKAQTQQHSLLLTDCKQNLLHIVVISESPREAAPQFQFQTWASQALHTLYVHLLSQSLRLSRVQIRRCSGILSSLYYSYDHKRAGVRKLLRKKKKSTVPHIHPTDSANFPPQQQRQHPLSPNPSRQAVYWKQLVLSAYWIWSALRRTLPFISAQGRPRHRSLPANASPIN